MTGVPRPYADFGGLSPCTTCKMEPDLLDPRLTALSPRQHSVGDFDQMRSHSASSIQNFYASQRHQPRPNEAEQLMQAKRRMAAQRERELRNYHQEQQYNRSGSRCVHVEITQLIGDQSTDISTQGKADRAISPNTMNDEDRRELIARQHRALYGNDGGSFYEVNNYGEESNTPRPSTQVAGTPTAAVGRGPSPLGLGLNQAQPQSAHSETQLQYSAPEQNQPSQASVTKGPSPKPQQQQQRSRANSTSSPVSNPQNFSLFENATQQSSRTSTSSPGGSPPRQTKVATAPIGTRPSPNQATNPVLNKRATTPLPSPLSYGFAPTENLGSGTSGNERSTSAASNPSNGAKESNMGTMTWGSNSGVWGKTSLGVQASVWG